jgi:ATP-dependent Lhr-like helicase
VVIVDGAPALYVERGGGSLVTLPAADDPVVAAQALAALRDLLDGRVRELVVTKVDGQPVSGSARRQSLLDSGFVVGYRGLVLRSVR